MIYEVDYQDSNETLENAAKVREEELRRRGKEPVMVSFVLLSCNVSGTNVLCHEELSRAQLKPDGTR